MTGGADSPISLTRNAAEYNAHGEPTFRQSFDRMSIAYPLSTVLSTPSTWPYRNRFGKAPGPTGLPRFEAEVPGLFGQQSLLRVALPILNVSGVVATEVAVTGVTLQQTGPVNVLNSLLGTIGTRARAVLEVDFANPQVAEGAPMHMRVNGTYRRSGLDPIPRKSD